MCGEGGTKSCAIFWSFLYLLSGLGLLGIGIWIRVDEEVYDAMVMENPDLMESKTPWRGLLGGLIAIGIYLFLVGILGMAGSACDLDQKVKNSLIAFAVFASLGTIGTIIFSGFVTYNFVQMDKLEMRGEMTADLVTHYLNDEGAFANTGFVRAWNYWQVQEECCGVNGENDYLFWDLLNLGSKKVPWSCCQLKDNVDKDDADSKDDVRDYTKCQNEASGIGNGNTELFGPGCFDSHYEVFKRNQVVALAMGWTAVFVQIVAMIVTGVLKNMARD